RTPPPRPARHGGAAPGTPRPARRGGPPAADIPPPPSPRDRPAPWSHRPGRASFPPAEALRRGSNRLTSSLVDEARDPRQGPDAAVVGGRLGQAEELSGLAVAETLQGPQRQDLAVQLVEAVEVFLGLESPLGADRRLAGRGQPPEQLRRQRG